MLIEGEGILAHSPTIELARRLGGGATLTDGARRFEVSDWSPGAGAVYGREIVGDGRGEYGRLPDALRLPTPREDGMAAGLAADEGPEYGESDDPETRVLRRMLGTDGLRDDLHDAMRPFDDEIADVVRRAMRVGAGMVRVRLRRLEEAFPRHRFRLVSFMFSVACLEVEPPIHIDDAHPTARIGDWAARRIHRNPRGDRMADDVARFVAEQDGQITKIVLAFSDGYRADMGVVTTDEAADLAAEEGTAAEPAPEG